MSEEEEDILCKLQFLRLIDFQESCSYFTFLIKIGSPDTKIILNCRVLLRTRLNFEKI